MDSMVIIEMSDKMEGYVVTLIVALFMIAFRIRNK